MLTPASFKTLKSSSPVPCLILTPIHSFAALPLKSYWIYEFRCFQNRGDETHLYPKAWCPDHSPRAQEFPSYVGNWTLFPRTVPLVCVNVIPSGEAGFASERQIKPPFSSHQPLLQWTTSHNAEGDHRGERHQVAWPVGPQQLLAILKWTILRETNSFSFVKTSSKS